MADICLRNQANEEGRRGCRLHPAPAPTTTDKNNQQTNNHIN